MHADEESLTNEDKYQNLHIVFSIIYNFTHPVLKRVDFPDIMT
jgi:hypothetical protein